MLRFECVSRMLRGGLLEDLIVTFHLLNCKEIICFMHLTG